MSEITPEYIEQYLFNLQPERDALLRRLETEAERRNIPIIGPYAGRFLYLLVKLSRAKNILEVGTAIGYSAIWLAKAAQDRDGKVTTIEVDAAMAEEARKNVAEARLSKRIKIIVGDGIDIVPKLRGKFDFMFLDSEKHQYRQLVELALPKLKKGALIATDNVLWGGTVARNDPDETAQQIRAFNQWLKNHPQLDTVFVPVRDGIALSLKHRSVDCPA